MKKILIRAGMSPIKDTSVEEIIHFGVSLFYIQGFNDR